MEEERGGRERIISSTFNFVLCTFHGSTAQHPINLVYIVHNSFVVTLLD